MNTTPYDALTSYGKWILDQPGSKLMALVLHTARVRVGNFTGYTVHRSVQFQTQVWKCDPNSEIPAHSHPNVDSIQMFLFGDIRLFLDGSEKETEESQVSIPPGRIHSAKIGPLGASFISFQLWLKGDPTSVEQDWDGPALDNKHAELLAYQKHFNTGTSTFA